jgi:serine phosphatase RsbU (regulator of sigma subunit)
VDAGAELRRTFEALQASFLPSSLPSVPGLRLGAHYQPAGRHVAVGGDFFDVFRLADGRWALVIADVCGKGAGAAAVTAMARYTIRTAALEHDDPRDVLMILNQALVSELTDRPFVTACLIFIGAHPDGATATVSVAGHPLPLLRTRSGDVISVGQAGDLLGVLDTPVFAASTIELRDGDALLLYTDGFTEARDDAGHQLGETGLAELLLARAEADPAELVAALAAALARHTGSQHTRDDAAALAVRVDSGDGTAADR